MKQQHMSSRKGFSAIVTLTLLIVIAILTTISFQGWLNSFTSSILSDERLQITEPPKFQKVIGGKLYLHNTNAKNISISSIKVDNRTCDFSGTLETGVETIDISDCLKGKKRSAAVILIRTDSNLFSYSAFIRDEGEEFSPDNLENLSLWLDAADSSSLNTTVGNISGWLDKSPQNNHATQNNAGRQPSLVLEDGKQLTYFSNERLLLPDFLSSTSSAEMFVVVKIPVYPPSNSLYTGSWSFGNGNYRPHYTWTDGNIYDDFGRDTRPGVSPHPSVNMTELHIFNIASEPNNWIWRQNGNVIYQTSSGTVTFTSSPTIGYRDTSYVMEGYIAEFIIYSRVLTSEEREDIHEYLTTKWLS